MIISIIMVIFVSLIFGLGITYYVNEWYKIPLELTDWEYWFNSQNFDPNKKKIYLIGASQVGRLNATYIDEYISRTNTNFEVYNLSINTDVPIKRINLLQEIIDSKPVMVVYGITFRDFLGELPNTDYALRDFIGEPPQDPITDVIGADKPTSILPDPGKFFYNWMDDQTMIDFSNFDNSQETILNLFGLIPEQNMTSKFKPASHDTPFIHNRKMMTPILDEEGMNKSYRDFLNAGITFNGFEEGKDIDEVTLKKIITTLKKNNIEVILFSTPFPRVYLDKIDNSDIEIFESLLEEVADEFDVIVYHLYDKYADMNIWTDVRHISMKKTANIFSSDMAKIISNEIKP